MSHEPGYALITVEHDPSDDCQNTHCHWHNVDESAAGAYIWCFECGHVYQTKRALRWAYRRKYVSLFPQWWGWGLPWFFNRGFGTKWQLLRGLVGVPRAKNIYFCQECSHDF